MSSYSASATGIITNQDNQKIRVELCYDSIQANVFIFNFSPGTPDMQTWYIRRRPIEYALVSTTENGVGSQTDNDVSIAYFERYAEIYLILNGVDDHQKDQEVVIKFDSAPFFDLIAFANAFTPIVYDEDF